MESIKIDSIDVLESHPELLDTLIYWMDCGTDITRKMRNNLPLTETEQTVLEELNYLISEVVTEEKIVVFRGISNLELSDNCVIIANQLSSVSPVVNASEEYGDVITIHVPAGTNCFYVAAWEHFLQPDDEVLEKEILLPPGEFRYLDTKKEFEFFQY